MNKPYLLAIVLLIFPLPTLANSPEYCVKKFEEGTEVYFEKSLGPANDAILALCNAKDNNNVMFQELYDKLKSFHQAIQKEAVLRMPQLSEYLYFFDEPLIEQQGSVVTGQRPYIKVSKPDPLNPNLVEKIIFSRQGIGGPVSVDVPNPQAQSCHEDVKCSNALESYRRILQGVYRPLSLPYLGDTIDFLTRKDKEWTSYIEEARGQTFLDIAFTSFLYEWKYGKNEHDFHSPPKIQWFALRPNVLIENVSNALDGDQLKESLALEVIGFNYWKDVCFGYACGASLIINYTDRRGIEDMGWGVMFHVDNSYSFGITSHDGDDGYFVTVDLLKLFQDKKSSFDDYKKKYRSLAK